MRRVILSYLKDQKPSRIFKDFEKTGLRCSYISRIWIDSTGKAFVFECYYTLMLVFHPKMSLSTEYLEDGSVIPLLGSSSIDVRLSRMISEFPSIDDIIYPENGASLSVISQFLDNLEYSLLQEIRSVNSLASVSDVEVLDILVLNFGVYSIVFRINSSIVSYVLSLGLVNYITLPTSCDQVICAFLEEVLSKYFEVVWRF